MGLEDVPYICVCHYHFIAFHRSDSIFIANADFCLFSELLTRAYLYHICVGLCVYFHTCDLFQDAWFLKELAFGEDFFWNLMCDAKNELEHI